MLRGKSSTSTFSRLFLFSLFSILSLINRFDSSPLSTSLLRVHAFPLPLPSSHPESPLQGANSSSTSGELGGIETVSSESLNGAGEPAETRKEGGQQAENNISTTATTKDRHRSSRPLHLVDAPSPPAPAASSSESAHRPGPGPGVSSIPLIQRPISPSYIHRIQAQYAQAAAAGTTRSSTGGIPGWNPLWGIGPVVPPRGSHLFDALTTAADDGDGDDEPLHAAEDEGRDGSYVV